MPTMAPPDGELDQRFARIDERFARVDERFDEVNRRITEGREETNRRFDRIESDIRNLKEGDIGDLKKSVGSLQESVASIHATLTRLSYGFALTVLGAILTKSF